MRIPPICVNCHLKKTKSGFAYIAELHVSLLDASTLLRQGLILIKQRATLSLKKTIVGNTIFKKKMNLKLNISNNRILTVSIGIAYLWFGTLKYFPNQSPAEDLAKNTIDVLTFSLIPSNVSIILLAIWESLVGVLLIMNIYKRVAILLAIVHMTLTFTPLFLFPEQMFINTPFQLTLVGQYIIKNIVIIVALFSLYNLSTKTPKLG